MPSPVLCTNFEKPPQNLVCFSHTQCSQPASTTSATRGPTRYSELKARGSSWQFCFKIAISNLCSYVNKQQKGACLYQSGAIQRGAADICWEQLAQTTPWIHHWIFVLINIEWRFPNAICPERVCYSIKPFASTNNQTFSMSFVSQACPWITELPPSTVRRGTTPVVGGTTTATVRVPTESTGEWGIRGKQLFGTVGKRDAPCSRLCWRFDATDNAKETLASTAATSSV